MAVGQASTVFKLSSTSDLRARRLYLSALNVGRDHIGSLVNTLALAYFGGALPLIVLMSLGYQPLSVAINSEEITQSVMAVLIASIGLVLCVPLTTAIAVALALALPFRALRHCDLCAECLALRLDGALVSLARYHCPRPKRIAGHQVRQNGGLRRRAAKAD